MSDSSLPRSPSASSSQGGLLSLLKRSSSLKKHKRDSEDGQKSGSSTPTNCVSPPHLVPDPPSNFPFLPSSLHPSPTSALFTSPHRASSRLAPNTSSFPSSSQLNYPSSPSLSTSKDVSSSPERPKPSLLGMRKSSSYSKRQGKQPAVDNEGESILRSPERPPRLPRHARPPSLDLSSSGFLMPAYSSSPVPSQISLPPDTPSEALEATDIIELQAFVDKERWIEDRIEFLRSLPPIECFIALMPTFKDGEQVLPTVKGIEGGALPTKEELDHMFSEQDRIEEEAERFDGGDLERLRKMAKAASQKNLSLSDTDLLSLTLTTLYLLDTLLHLLRARGETLDLLALRLQWDSMRFSIATETEALERDVKAFVEGKARWGLDTYGKSAAGAGGGSSSPVIGTMAREKGHGREDSDTGSIRSVGGKPKVASRSQRYLLTQILELDSQSFHNRISSLRLGPVTQAGRTLDKMIDVASSVRSHQAKTKKKRMGSSPSVNRLDSSLTLAVASEETASKEETIVEEPEEKELDEAVPVWFLDEMDRVNERVKGLTEYEELARESVKQWKFADQTFHTVRKLHNDSSILSSDLSQAFLQHPTVSRSKAFTAKASAIVSDLSLVPDASSPSSSSFPRPTHPYLSSLPSSNRNVASLLTEELSAAKDEARKAHKMAKEYTKLVERVESLESLKVEMESLAGQLEAEGKKLENGVDGTKGGERVDLSTPDCLKSDTHSAYLAHFPIISFRISSLQSPSTEALRETGALLLALRSAGGVDPNFRSSVEATATRLETALSKASAAREPSALLIARLGRCRSVVEAQTTTTREIVDLKAKLIARIEGARWAGLDNNGTAISSRTEPSVPIATLVEEVSALGSSISKRVSLPFNDLSSSLKEYHPQLISHLSLSVARIQERLASLRELSRLLQAVAQQSDAMVLVAAESSKHTQASADLGNSIEEAVAAADEGGEDRLANEALLSQLASHQTTARTFASSLSSRIPFVSSPTSTSALLPALNQAHAHSPLTPPRSPAQPFFSADLHPAEPSTSIDLTALDALVRSDANLLTATLSGVVERLEELFDSIAVAREGRATDLALEACEMALSAWSETLVEQGKAAGREATLQEWAKRVLVAKEALQTREAQSSKLVTSLETAHGTLRGLPHASETGNIEERTLLLERVRGLHAQRQGQSEEVLARLETAVKAERERLEEEERARLDAVEGKEKRQKEETEATERDAKRSKEEEARIEEERVEQARVEREKAAAEATKHAEEEKSRIIAKKIKKDLAAEADYIRRAEDISTPRSWTNTSTSAIAFPSSNSATDDDVFGPVAGSATTPRVPSLSNRSLLDQIHSLQTRLDALDLRSVTSIPSALASTPGMHHLPSLKQHIDAKNELESIDQEVSSLSSSTTQDDKDALLALRASLAEDLVILARMELLSAFSTAVTSCDESFSSLLDQIDEAAPLSRSATPNSTSKSHSSLRNTLTSAKQAFDSAVEASRKVQPEDPCVEAEVRRITQAFEEMKEMAEEKTDPLAPQDRRRRSASISSSFGGSVDGSLNGDDGETSQQSLRSMSRSSTSASIASFTSPPASRIPKSISTSHDLSSASTSLRSRLPSASSRPRIPSMMFKPPASVNTTSTPRSFSGPASSTPTAPKAVSSSSDRRQSNYHSQTISSSSRERTLSTLSSSSTSTQVPSTPVRARLPSIPNGRISSPSPFQNPPTPVASSGARSHSTLGRYKRPSIASGVSSFVEEEEQSGADRRRSLNFGTTPRKSLSIRSKLDEVDGQSTPTKRVSLGGGLGTSVVSPVPRKRYRANKNDLLDRAVGRIVNALPVEIPIVPVVAGLESSESGKYWIGQPPKLCFCRILRSKTVMVRVGGGWVELSKFLRDHFGILLPSATSSVPLTSKGSDRWIRGGSTPLHTSVGAASIFVPPSTPGPSSSAHSPSTPITTFPRGSQSPQLVYSTPGVAFPYRTRHSSLSPATAAPSFNSPVLAQGVEVGSPGSPLVPLHLMRKADDNAASPPMTSSVGRNGKERPSLGCGGAGNRQSFAGGEAASSTGRSISGGSVSGRGGKTSTATPWRA